MRIQRSAPLLNVEQLPHSSEAYCPLTSLSPTEWSKLKTNESESDSSRTLSRSVFQFPMYCLAAPNLPSLLSRVERPGPCHFPLYQPTQCYALSRESTGRILEGKGVRFPAPGCSAWPALAVHTAAPRQPPAEPAASSGSPGAASWCSLPGRLQLGSSFPGTLWMALQ